MEAVSRKNQYKKLIEAIDKSRTIQAWGFHRTVTDKQIYYDINASMLIYKIKGWKRTGPTSFQFEVLDYCQVTEVLQDYGFKLKINGDPVNMCRKVDLPENQTKYLISGVTRQNIRQVYQIICRQVEFKIEFNWVKDGYQQKIRGITFHKDTDNTLIYRRINLHLASKYPQVEIYPETVKYQITLHDFLFPGLRSKQSARKELRQIFEMYQCIPFHDVYLQGEDEDRDKQFTGHSSKIYASFSCNYDQYTLNYLPILEKHFNSLGVVRLHQLNGQTDNILFTKYLNLPGSATFIDFKTKLEVILKKVSYDLITIQLSRAGFSAGKLVGKIFFQSSEGAQFFKNQWIKVYKQLQGFYVDKNINFEKYFSKQQIKNKPKVRKLYEEDDEE